MIQGVRRAKEAAKIELSDDLRKRVAESAVEEGLSRDAAAKRFKVNNATAIRWVGRFHDTGETSPMPTGGDHRSERIEARLDYLLGLIGRQPDITFLEIRERLIANCGQRISTSVLWRSFDRHQITFKKAAYAEEQQRPDVLKRRRERFVGQLDLDPMSLVFIDKTGTSTKMGRKSGRRRRGRRLRAGVLHGHYRNVTLVAGQRLHGLAAQKAYDKPMNTATFEEWVEKCLAPTLSKGDVVVMDNLSSHTGTRVEQLLNSVGATLKYLPPYSPDLNPIEKALSQLKAHLRKIAERSVAGLPPPPPFPGIVAGVIDESAGAGSLTPHDELQFDGELQRLDDIVGRHFGVIGDATVLSALNEDARAAAAAIGARFVAPRGSPYVESHDRISDWLRRHDAKVVITRPDFYAYGLARDLSDASRQLKALAAKLSA